MQDSILIGKMDVYLMMKAWLSIPSEMDITALQRGYKSYYILKINVIEE